MRKVFLDTNVILDYYLDREGFSNDAEAILAGIVKCVYYLFQL